MDFLPESFDATTTAIPQVLFYVVLFLEYVCFAASLALHRLGLRGQPPELPIPYWDDDLVLRQYFPITTASAGLAPLPSSPRRCDPAAAASSSSVIKNQLRVVEFSSLRRRRSSKVSSRESEAEEASATCTICLGEVEAEQKVRELGNCGHGFHLECIDGWVEVGQVTCPLCRADLLPPAAAGLLSVL